jgi:hypothetical protein
MFPRDGLMIAKDFPFVKDSQLIRCKSFAIMVWHSEIGGLMGHSGLLVSRHSGNFMKCYFTGHAQQNVTDPVGHDLIMEDFH